MYPTSKLILVLVFLFFACRNSYSQADYTDTKEIIKQCSSDSILSYLKQFEALGIKELGTPALDKTAQWLENKYISFGYQKIVKDSFNFKNNKLVNLVVEKKGSIYPDSLLIICGHYDTKNGPGAGDNGSGTAVILEIARIFSKINTSVSIRFIQFSAEEEGLIGSDHYVNQVLPKENPEIKLVLNIDAIGGVAGKKNNVLVCEFDKESPPASNNQKSLEFAKKLSFFIEKYSNLKTRLNRAYASDYMPFEQKGYVITGIYEDNQSPYAHTDKDIISNIDVGYIFEAAKGVVAAVAYFTGIEKE
ncbi:MAG: M28 family metallopeptidase [Bacteroidales bacterium]